MRASRNRTTDASANAVPSEARSDSSRISNALRQYFAACPDIEAIFLTDYEGRFVATVITDHGQYRRDAMLALFEQEYHLREATPLIDLEINYLPRLGRSLSEIVSAHAVQIFARK